MARIGKKRAGYEIDRGQGREQKGGTIWAILSVIRHSAVSS